jgi:metal-responsive CopG/Arc/MetJ family transcriptional regulator
MAYRGSTIVPVRIPDELLTLIDETIARVNPRKRDEPFDRSSFIRKAILEKLNHYTRSNPKGSTDETLPRVTEAIEGTQSVARDNKTEATLVVH